MEKAVLTLYTVIGNPERIPASIQKHFKEVTKSIGTKDGTTTLTLLDDTQIIFNMSHQSSKPDFIASHIGGMADFFAQVETEQEKLKQDVLHQIQCFNCVTGISFGIDEDKERINYLFHCFYCIAEDVKGFILYPDMEIYTSEGKLLFSTEGKSEFTAFTPIANADLLDAGRPEETEADKARTQRSIAILKEMGIPFMEHLRSEVSESEAVLRSREEMVQRAAALFAVSVYSEVMLSENSSRKEALKYVDKINEMYDAGKWMTPDEKAYINDPEPEQQTCLQFVWRYECCGVLLWAAGIVEELPYPSEIIDVPVLAAIFWQSKGIADLMSKGFARPETEILDMADLTLRYDWACVDARIKGNDAPASLDEGVVVERHYAFNWIIGANNHADWDDIQPNT